MDDNQELRRNWRVNWLGSIQEFADEETQRRTWLNTNNTNPHYSFVECYCCYFGLSGGGYQWALEQGLLSANEVDAVAEFHAIADAYEAPNRDDYDHDGILADPKWAGVVAAARRAQATLLTLIDDPSERVLLTEPSHHAIAAGQA
jgi:hypothetical protein